MSATIAVRENVSFGNLLARIVRVTGDTSYVTGGYSVTAASVGLGQIRGASPAGANTTLYTGRWNNATSKVEFVNGGTEASGNVSAVSVDMLFIGY